MAISNVHAFTSAIADDAAAQAAGEVLPSHWNAEHALTCATGKLLGRTTAGTGAVEEVTPGTGVLTALQVNVGSAGAFVVLNGALGTPSSGTLTNATGLPAAGVVGTAAILGANTFTGAQLAVGTGDPSCAFGNAAAATYGLAFPSGTTVSLMRNGNHFVHLNGSGVVIPSNIYFGWNSTGTPQSNGAVDVSMQRDEANALAIRSVLALTSAQTLRVYGTYTDASNYERASLSTTAGSGITLAAETAGTGGDNLNVTLTPAGTGGVVIGANYQQFAEMTAPAAGAANTVRLFAQDNGAGKTQLMAIFASGAAQQVAIEP